MDKQHSLIHNSVDKQNTRIHNPVDKQNSRIRNPVDKENTRIYNATLWLPKVTINSLKKIKSRINNSGNKKNNPYPQLWNK